MNYKNSSPKTDIGDYMKVFACTAVMMQSVLAFVLKTQPSFSDQNIIGFTYNFVKFTAPAFIFGILYTTTRQTNQNKLRDYPAYLHKQWNALFVPTICWTLIYLLVFPQLQQHSKFTSLGTFLWQFINGNAAPHLWYNTMMLQFILIMPLFWFLARKIKNKPVLSIVIAFGIIVFYCWWLYFYNMHISLGSNWYLLDRIFISFIIYAVLGTLAAMNQQLLEKYLPNFFLSLLLLFFVTTYWTNFELFSDGYPIKLTNAPYYKFSMTLYALTIIGLIASLAIKQLKKNSKSLSFFHFLAIYAYRAYLSNVLWLQIIWTFGGQALAKKNSLLAIISCYLLTWVLSFTSAYVLHISWIKVKQTKG